ncbi:carbonic anhydrase [Streptomyces ziwulingensis]|uniref:Carbonic anhydrase n=1 Tax=Streptomyces ziwulingensis TaxID=1045501 RepID=A0ABP9BZ98_9ACTN
MQPLIDHARLYGQRPEEFARYAAGQTPDVLFVTCSDSRVVPALITGVEPGQLFELRTAGNVVPSHLAERPTGEAATIEYAVQALGVADIVVCGHSHCGAVGAMVRGDDLSDLPAVRDWLRYGAETPKCADPFDPTVAEAVQNHIRAQLIRLQAYPSVERRLTEGRLRLHGWYYEVHTGGVRTLHADTDTFETL